MKDEFNFTVKRSDVEDIAARPLTDKEWEVMAEEIEGMLNHYYLNDTPLLLEDLESLTEERSDSEE